MPRGSEFKFYSVFTSTDTHFDVTMPRLEDNQLIIFFWRVFIWFLRKILIQQRSVVMLRNLYAIIDDVVNFANVQLVNCRLKCSTSNVDC